MNANAHLSELKQTADQLFTASAQADDEFAAFSGAPNSREWLALYQRAVEAREAAYDAWQQVRLFAVSRRLQDPGHYRA